MIETLKSLVRVLRKSKFSRAAKYSDLNRGRAFVLGNGPSLANERPFLLKEFRGQDFFCVNYFANSDLYTDLRPKYYILADPGFWKPDVSGKLLESRNLLINNIKSRTNWPLTIFVPFEAEDVFCSAFRSQSEIQISFFNNVPLYGRIRVVHELYRFGLGCPQVQNVLIAALFMAIQEGYKEIILLGADHSWHETLVLDRLNKVCLKDKHFYNQEARLVPFSIGCGESRTFTMSEAFYAIGRMFEGYRKLESYSKHVGAKILNASSITYVDAFERVRAADLVPRN